MTDDAIVAAALRLRNAYTSGTVAPLRDCLEPQDGEAADTIQDVNTRFWEASGRELVGRKIGLTAKAVQAGAFRVDTSLADMGAGAGRSRNTQSWLCRRLFEFPAPCRKGEQRLWYRHACHPRRTRTAPHGWRAGRHDCRRRARHDQSEGMRSNTWILD